MRPTPNFYIALDTTALRKKLQALKLYKSQLKVNDGPLSIHGARTLAHMRGLECGEAAAEAYTMQRFLL